MKITVKFELITTLAVTIESSKMSTSQIMNKCQSIEAIDLCIDLCMLATQFLKAENGNQQHAIVNYSTLVLVLFTPGWGVRVVSWGMAAHIGACTAPLRSGGWVLSSVGPRWAPCWPHELCHQGAFHWRHSRYVYPWLFQLAKCDQSGFLEMHMHVLIHWQILIRRNSGNIVFGQNTAYK